MIRSFVAIDIPEDVRAAIGDTQARLKRAPLSVRVSWAKVDNIHLTLQFLGYIEEEVVEPIGGALDAVAQQHVPFDLPVRGAGAFPSERRPRVLWAGVDDSAGQLKALALGVQTAMQALRFEPEHREFSAHLTLGRVKFPKPDTALTRVLDSLKDTDFGTMRVAMIHLVQSQLHPEGSIYTKLSSHKLRGEISHAGQS